MESTIKKLFDRRDRKFEIPSYQRAYSWTNKEINQFIEDIKHAENQYYLGHFLFEHKEDNTLYVIDGQQRLTTSIIFFSVLRKELEERQNQGESISINLDDITDYYLKDIRKNTQKFKTVKDDNNFFLEEVIDLKENHFQETDTKSKTRIKEAKNTFKKEFVNTDTQELIRWCELIENATITEYLVKNKTQATQVFAFQNDRGKKLSNLEIIKAYFMLQIYLSSNAQEQINDNIGYLEDEISKIYKQIIRINTDEDEVLNYYWRTVSGKGFSSGEVITGIKSKITSLTNNKTDWIKNFTSGLSKAFNTIEKIETSEEGFTKDLRHLNNMALAYPFIIKAYNIGASEKTVSRLIRFLENITFRYLLRGGRAEIESRLNQYLVNCDSDEDINNNISKMVKNLKDSDWWGYWNNYSMEHYLNGYFYKNRVDNYLLWKYELFISDVNHPRSHRVSFEDLIHNESIEHIAPQTPTNNDPVANGYGIYEDKENPHNGIVSGNLLNCVGNLVLISGSLNSSMSNKAFSEKIQLYGKDNLLNQQKEIINFVNDPENLIWDKDAINARRRKIIDAANKIWDLDNI